MLKTHCDLATSCDIKKENTFILSNGDVLNITKDAIYKEGRVPADDIYVDGSRIGDVGSTVIKDRKLMSSNGILVVIANIDLANKRLLNTPMITTRGYILVNENEVLIRQIEKNSYNIIDKKLKSYSVNYNDIKTELINGLMPFLLEKTGRVPIILPIW
jgi:ribonuclease J